MTMLDILSIGDATLDTFLEIDEATVTCTLDRDDCVICLTYADKIPVKSLEKKVAGNAVNFAVGSARLGLKSAFWTILGDDQFADDVIAKMKEEGVSTKYVQKDKGTMSNYTTVLNYKGERTQLIYRLPRKYDPPKFNNARYVYLTAMGPNHEDAYQEIIDYKNKISAKLVYNPGKEQMRCGHKVCKEIYNYVDILIVNKEEAVMILEGREPEKHKGTEKIPTTKIKQILKGLFEIGPNIVLVTDGANGSYAFVDNKYYHMGILEGEIVEKTGAGDAYSTGFISALIKGKSVKEAMVWGTLNSWSVIQKVGPIDGLLKTRKMNALVKEHPRLKPKEI